MTLSNKAIFKLVLAQADKVSNLSTTVRHTVYTNRDIMIKSFASIWVEYEELLSLTRSLIANSEGECNEFFSSCYEGYLNEYRQLKKDISGPVLSPIVEIKELPEESENQTTIIYLIEKITRFESENAHLLGSGRTEKIAFFFKELASHHRRFFEYILDVFKAADDGAVYEIDLTSKVRLNHLCLTLVDHSNIKQWNDDYTQFEKLYLELSRTYVKMEDQIKEGNSGKLILVFRESVDRLAGFSKSKPAFEIDYRAEKLVSVLSADKVEQAMVDLFSDLLDSSNVNYTPYRNNRYLILLRNCCWNCLAIVQVISSSMHLFVKNHYELSFMFQFMKRYVIKALLPEFHKRLVVYTKTRKRAMQGT